MARDERPGVLRAGGRLSIDSARSPAWAASATSGPSDEGVDRRLAERPQQDATTTVVATTPPIEAGVRLRRRDVGQELRAARTACRPGRRRCRTTRPRGPAAGSSPARRRASASGASGGIGRRRVAEPEDEREQRHVERPEDRRHPGRQAVARIGAGRTRRPRPGRSRRRRAAGRCPRGRSGTRRRGRPRAPGRCRAPGAPGSRPPQQAEDLERGERRDDRDDRGEDRPAEAQHDEQDRARGRRR